MRHSFHTVEEVQELVDSRVIDEDGRIIETLEGSENPPNVIRGSNAEL